MAKITLRGTLLAKTNTAAQWTETHPVLGIGEPGIETDTALVKYGDGVTDWNNLDYSKAGALALERIIRLSGEVSGEASFDGSKDIEIAVTIGDLLDAALDTGVFPKLSVRKDGRISAVGSYDAADIIDALGILDDDGKLLTDLMPALALTSVNVVESEEEMLALDVQAGDVAVRTDINKSFILKGDDPTDIDSWTEILSPLHEVLSVNGKTGAVELDTDDIEEGAENLYYTVDRANAAINSFLTENTFVFDGNY